MNALHEYVKNKNIHKELSEALFSFSIEEKELLIYLIDQIQPSANALSDIVSMLSDISARDEISFTQFLNQEKLEQLFNGLSQSNRKEKSSILKQYLRRIRYPEVSKIEAEIESNTTSILKNHGIALKLPEFLEGDSLTIEFRFKNKASVAKAGETLINLSQDPALEKIYSLLKGLSE